MTDVPGIVCGRKGNNVDQRRKKSKLGSSKKDTSGGYVVRLRKGGCEDERCGGL